MKKDSLLEYIFKRLVHSENKLAIFSTTETILWPDGALDVLLQSGLLEPAQPANVTICQGCEENCPMPVDVFPATDVYPARAFIVCDNKYVRYGRAEDIHPVTAVPKKNVGRLICPFPQPAKH